MTKVCLFATGGTIASRFDAETGDVTVKSSSAHFTDLGRQWVPEVEIEAIDFCNIGSYALDLDTAFSLVSEISRTLQRPDVAGVVVTHGTDTLEETAFLADLLVNSPKPVVFTGAQRAADEPDTDGPRNFADAVRVAAAPEAVGLGALVVFEQEIHAARDATKTHASRVGTFQSAEHGKLGEVDRGRVIVHRAPRHRPLYRCQRLEPRVDLIKMVMGADRRFIDCALATGAKGLVIEAFGRGNVTPSALEGVRDAVAAGVPVLIASRCPSGRVAPVYGGSGGSGLQRANAHFAGDLSPVKARILLSVLLGSPGYRDDLGSIVDAIAA